MVSLSHVVVYYLATASATAQDIGVPREGADASRMRRHNSHPLWLSHTPELHTIEDKLMLTLIYRHIYALCKLHLRIFIRLPCCLKQGVPQKGLKMISFQLLWPKWGITVFNDNPCLSYETPSLKWQGKRNKMLQCCSYLVSMPTCLRWQTFKVRQIVNFNRLIFWPKML